MNIQSSSRLIGSAVLAFILCIVPAAANAQRLGGGAAPEVSFIRVAAALVVCLAIALFALLLIRQRQQRGKAMGFLSIFTRLKGASSRFEIVEARRLNPTNEVCLLRFEHREYLLLLSQGHSRLLSERSLDATADAGAA